MLNINKRTLEDLEFDQVLEQVAAYCITEAAKSGVLAMRPFGEKKDARRALQEVNDYKSSFENENRIPNHGFEPVQDTLKFLSISDFILEIESFRRIAILSRVANTHIDFNEKFQSYYPNLHARSGSLEKNSEIERSINAIIDKDGEVKDDASDLLFELRQSIKRLKTKINSGFSRALSQYQSRDYLDDIRESIIDGKRVLAIKAMYRRKVKGSILGSSKTGSIVFIEPEVTLVHQRELNNLQYEEREEIKKILFDLSNGLREFHPTLSEYHEFLILLDTIYARARYALAMDAVLPEISEEKILFLRDAYHPLLLLSNREQGKETFPQTLKMNGENRIIVISGPNAGGKSITLKTVGLLQLMLQSGLLVPVHERSIMCFFDRILSDIGDNQSIENQLSTYSYRLKQMNYFLRKCNANTLFLIDEFGTGSDPELGGALAEIFLEVFYEKGAYGVITTHYTNLKMLADEKPQMQNANMLFDERSLQPIFKLVLGEAGSSFTFEVAQKNGIPYSLINKAKKKIERSKVRFDKTIAKLQKERSKLERLERSLKINEQRKIAETDKLEGVNAKVQYKLERYQELYDANQRLIYLGQKVEALARKYQQDERKRDLLAELFKIVQIENSKRKDRSSKKIVQKKSEAEKIRKEVHRRIKPIRERKKALKKKEEKQVKPKPNLEVGDRVRLEDGRAVGSIDKIEKNKAFVNYGQFTTKVHVEQLELVEKKK
ncbi:MAG: DNA mismatch repair protein MutS [Bacteroidia bacterium]|nr:DNA mismatch repair protein MutS [Bacteroidia bacterium]